MHTDIAQVCGQGFREKLFILHMTTLKFSVGICKDQSFLAAFHNYTISHQYPKVIFDAMVCLMCGQSHV